MKEEIELRTKYVAVLPDNEDFQAYMQKELLRALDYNEFKHYDKVIFLNTMSEKFKLRQKIDKLEIIHLAAANIQTRVSTLIFWLNKYQNQNIRIVICDISDFVNDILDEFECKELIGLIISKLSKNSTYTICQNVRKNENQICNGHLGLFLEKKADDKLFYDKGELHFLH